MMGAKGKVPVGEIKKRFARWLGNGGGGINEGGPRAAKEYA